MVMAFGCRIRIRRRSLHVYGHNLVRVRKYIPQGSFWDFWSLIRTVKMSNTAKTYQKCVKFNNSVAGRFHKRLEQEYIYLLNAHIFSIM